MDHVRGFDLRVRAFKQGRVRMSKNKKRAGEPARSLPVADAENETSETGRSRPQRLFNYVKTHILASAAILVLALLAFAGGLKYLEEDAARETAKNSKDRSALSSINPFMPAPPPAPTPQLSKEYVYAGSRLLAVEDAGASAVPPADLAVWRPSNGYWYVMGGPGATETYFQWGQNGDQVVQGDYDGDGKTDFSIYRGGSAGYWWITRSASGSYYSVTQGTRGDKPVPGDYDGDGKTDTALFRSSNSTWHIIKSSDSTTTSIAWGSSGDKTAQADYDGDGKTDLAVWRPSTKTFRPLRSSDGDTTSYQVGSAFTDTPVSADYDGDDTADYAVLSGNNWIIRSSSTGATDSSPGRTRAIPRFKTTTTATAKWTSLSGETRTATGISARALTATRCGWSTGAWREIYPSRLFTGGRY
jgi:hypothetical protein